MTRADFIQQVSKEQESLRRFLLALCSGDRNEADDIAQEALIKAYIALERYREEQKFSTWLFKIAHNTFLDHRRQWQPSNDIEEASQMLGDLSADEAFHYQELYAALNTLSPQEQSTLTLFYLQGYSVKEVAQITDTSVDAVKQQLSRGRNNLRKILNHER